MKLLAVAVGLCVAGLVSAQDPIPCAEEISEGCLDIDDPENPQYFPVPENCAQYCECSGGTAWLFTCPPGTVFDEESTICDFPVNVDCGDRPEPTELPPPPF